MFVRFLNLLPLLPLVMSIAEGASPSCAQRLLHATHGVDADQAARTLSESPLFARLSADQRTFMEELFLPVVGERGNHFPMRVGKGWLEWKGYPHSPLKYRVEFSADVDEPQLDLTDPACRRLILPQAATTGDWTGILKRFFLGHPLHPFMVDPNNRVEREELGEPSLLLRDVQVEAAEVGREYLKRFHDGDMTHQRFLYVAPTGTGKSEIYLNLLSTRLTQIGDNGLIIVSSDRANVVRDRMDEAKTLQQNGHDFDIVHWGGSGELNDDVHSVEELLARVALAKRPVVLITTSASLRLSYFEADRVTQKALRKNLRGVFVDEAHHLGGLTNSDILAKLINRNRLASLIGFTATPVSRTQSIQNLFNAHGFWAYEDNAEDYLKNPGAFYRDVALVAQQLRRAFIAGDLVGFDKVNYIPLSNATKGDLYVKRKKMVEGGTFEDVNRFVLNSEYYPELLAALNPIFLSGRGIMVANDITEAEDLTAAINLIYQSQKKNVRAEVITSKNAPANSKTERDILARFRSGETQILVSVNKLDEGINIHDANFYIDLNLSPSARSFLQRLGRTTRVSPAKTESHVYLLAPHSQETLEKMLHEVFFAPGQRRPKPAPTGTSHGNLEVAMEDFLDALERTNLERLDFWKPSRYSLSAEELTLFQQEVIGDVGETFPRFGSKTNAFIETVLAPKISNLAARTAFLKEVKDLHIWDSLIWSAQSVLGSADKLHQVFILFATAANFEVPERMVTRSHLEQWGVIPSRYSIPESELKLFQTEVLTSSVEALSGVRRKTNKFIEEVLAPKISNPKKRADFLREMKQLNLSNATIRSGETHLGSADNFHHVLVRFAEAAGHEVPERVKLSDLEAWGVVASKYSLADAEIKLFQAEVLFDVALTFRNYGGKANAFVQTELAPKIANRSKRAAFLKYAKDLNMSETTIRMGSDMPGPADCFHQVLLRFAEAAGHEVPKRVTLSDLEEWGVLPKGNFTSQSELKLFQEDVLGDVAETFPGFTTKTNAYVQTVLAAKISKPSKRNAFLKKVQEMDLPDRTIAEGNRGAGSARDFHGVLIQFAEAAGHEVRKRITLSQLRAWEVLPSKYSIPENELKQFQLEVLGGSVDNFSGYRRKTNAFTEEILAPLISNSGKRSAFLRKVKNMQLVDSIMRTGGVQLGSADKFHQVLILFAEAAEFEIPKRVKLSHLRAWRVIAR